MDRRCPRCTNPVEILGHEDGRTYYQCVSCNRIWPWVIGEQVALTGISAIPRVLIVDDSEPMVRMLGMWLEETGSEVVTALSGRQALDLAALQHPDVAFLDVVIPPPDGLRVCEALKRGAPTEVILMTGVSAPDERELSDADALMLLRKPFTREDALNAYTAALDHAHHHQRG